LAGLLTPAVIWFVRRVGVTGRPALPVLARHAGGIAVFSLVHGTSSVFLRTLLAPKAGGHANFAELARKQLSSNLDAEILIYAIILCAVYAHDRYRDLRAQEQAARALELEHVRLQAILSESRLEAMRRQLQPHFLFNALNGISTLILRGDNAAANEMLLHLSRFLRLTLDDDNSPEVPLARELELLDAYLQVQLARFGPRLRIEVDADPQTKSALVPSLLLQPLVENAIRHGIGAGAGGGTVAVRARRDGGSLRLTVTDSGPGLPAHGWREGFGLHNVRARLEQLHPGACQLTVGDAPGGGTTAAVVMPLRLAAAANAAAGSPTTSGGADAENPHPDRG
jgi:signal transduction histidine kinase